MRRISVGDIMTRNFVYAKPDASIYDCAKLMARERVDLLIISQNRKLVGILTSRDILWAITKKPSIDLKKINCMKIATKKVAVIKPSADMSQALSKMRSLNFRRLPVLSKGQLIGVVTLKDILAVEPELYSEMRSIMDEIREESTKKQRTETEWPIEGMCENCGAFSDLLKVEEQLLCQDCREDMF